MRVVCISDTHGHHEKLTVPEGDILIHAGDFTNLGEVGEIARFGKWFEAQPHPHKIYIAGNHDWLFQEDQNLARSIMGRATYLQDSFTIINGLKIHGTPWTLPFYDWAFMKPDEALEDEFSLIDSDVDILVTHGPPLGILDGTSRGSAGSGTLLQRIWDTSPRYHIFGHIHEGRGKLTRARTIHMNVSNYSGLSGMREPIIFDIDPIQK